jgi:hypothetical protein
MTTQQERPDGWGVIGDWRQYFSDPAMDYMAKMVVDLAAATWTTIDRQRVTEWILESRGQLRPGEVDSYTPSEEQEKQLSEERNAFVAGILEGFTKATGSTS